MAELWREITATRIALLELKDEKQLVQEGYELLDEKRILLASEIQRQLAQLFALQRQGAELADQLRSRTMAAAGRHGLEELAAYPPLTLAADGLELRRRRLFGLELLTARFVPSTQPAGDGAPPVNPTPEARACAAAHRIWLARAVELAACCVNLRRLEREYVRTERRARAIDQVLLPEIESALAITEEQLEGMDLEEIARLRRRSGGLGDGGTCEEK